MCRKNRKQQKPKAPFAIATSLTHIRLPGQCRRRPPSPRTETPQPIRVIFGSARHVIATTLSTRRTATSTHRRSRPPAAMSPDPIPLPDGHAEWRARLFDLDLGAGPVIMTKAQFDTFWPLVDSVYRKLNSTVVQRNGTVRAQKYECRLRNSGQGRGGKPQPSKNQGAGVAKRQLKKKRAKDLCQVRIKISQEIDAPFRVWVERMDDEVGGHRHAIDESYAIGIPSHLKKIIQRQVANGDAHADILKSLRGSSRLEDAGGKYLTRYGPTPPVVIVD